MLHSGRAFKWNKHCIGIAFWLTIYWHWITRLVVLEGWCTWTKALFTWSPMMDEDRMRPRQLAIGWGQYSEFLAVLSCCHLSDLKNIWPLQNCVPHPQSFCLQIKWRKKTWGISHPGFTWKMVVKQRWYIPRRTFRSSFIPKQKENVTKC